MSAAATEGSLDRYPLPRLLCFLEQKSFTGVLHLAAPTPPADIVIQNGVPVLLTPVSPQALTRLFLERGHLSNEQYGRVMQALTGLGAVEDDILKDIGGFRDEDIRKGRRYVLFQELCRLFRYRSGGFTLATEIDPRLQAQIDPGSAIEPLYLVFNGIQHAYNEARLQEELGLIADKAIRLKSGIEDRLSRIGFTEDEAEVLRLLGEGYWRLADLLSSVEHETLLPLMAIYTLLSAGLLELGDPSSVPLMGSPSNASIDTPPPSDAPLELEDSIPAPEQEAHEAMSLTPPIDLDAPPPAAPTAAVPIEAAPAEAAPTETPPTEAAPPSSGERQRVRRTAFHSSGAYPRLRAPPMVVRQAAVTAERLRAEKELKPEGVELLDEILDRLQAMDGQSPFELLGLELDATMVDVKKSYLALVKRLHPDRLAPQGLDEMAEAADALFKRITEAHQALSDPEKLEEARQIYTAESEGVDPETTQRMVEAEVDFQKGEVFFRKGDWAEAEEHFQRAVDGNPEEGEHLAMLTWTQYQRTPKAERPGKRDEIRQQLLRALELAPRCARGHYFLGLIYQEERNTDDAYECFKHAVRFRKNYLEAMREIRLIEMRRQKEQQGRSRSSIFDLFSRKKK